MGCKHKWKVLSDKVIQSAFEDGIKAGVMMEKIKCSMQYFSKVSITICCCELCGKIEKFETRSIIKDCEI